MRKIFLLLGVIISLNTLAQESNGVPKSTIITLADGTEKVIEDIKKDDLLLSMNEDGTSIMLGRVVDIKETTTYKLVKITLANGSEILLTPHHPLLSDKGWASLDDKATNLLETYASAKVSRYRVDSFVYTFNASSNVEVLPIIEIEEIVENTPIYTLVLDSSVAYIANGIFIGQ